MCSLGVHRVTRVTRTRLAAARVRLVAKLQGPAVIGLLNVVRVVGRRVRLVVGRRVVRVAVPRLRIGLLNVLVANLHRVRALWV